MTIKEYVSYRKQQLKDVVNTLTKVPQLIIINANEDPASKSYINGKLKDAALLNIDAKLIQLEPNVTQEQLIRLIEKYNDDSNCDGIIVQLPLPKHIDESIIKLTISKDKDVDGFHPLGTLNPCTPQGIINYLHHENITLEGKNALVIGRSNIVGKPMAKLLLNENCNVTICHSKTKFIDLKNYIENADIIVIAIGKNGFLDERFNYKSDAIIIDVGINRTLEGLKGDAKENLPVKLQTPVPGGVGLLTRLALYENLIKICLTKEKNNDGI